MCENCHQAHPKEEGCPPPARAWGEDIPDEIGMQPGNVDVWDKDHKEAPRRDENRVKWPTETQGLITPLVPVKLHLRTRPDASANAEPNADFSQAPNFEQEIVSIDRGDAVAATESSASDFDGSIREARENKGHVPEQKDRHQKLAEKQCKASCEHEQKLSLWHLENIVDRHDTESWAQQNLHDKEKSFKAMLFNMKTEEANRVLSMEMEKQQRLFENEKTHRLDMLKLSEREAEAPYDVHFEHQQCLFAEEEKHRRLMLALREEELETVLRTSAAQQQIGSSWGSNGEGTKDSKDRHTGKERSNKRNTRQDNIRGHIQPRPPTPPSWCRDSRPMPSRPNFEAQWPRGKKLEPITDCEPPAPEELAQTTPFGIAYLQSRHTRSLDCHAQNAGEHRHSTNAERDGAPDMLSRLQQAKQRNPVKSWIEDQAI